VRVTTHGPEKKEHNHHHHRGPDFDWDAMADALETDGALVLPLVETIVAGLQRAGIDAATVSRVVDIGCGPGVVACALAERFPNARITGVDSAPQLLERLRRRALAAGLEARVEGVEGDLEHELLLPAADIVWASMVVHHVADPAAVLSRLGRLLQLGGTLVVVEFGGHSRVLPADDPIVAGGTWARLQDAARAKLIERLGPDLIGRDWPGDLRRAGLTEITDDVVTFTHDAPLDELGRRWLVRNVRGGIGMAGDALTPADSDALGAFADAVEQGARTDAFVDAERRVLTARRARGAAPDRGDSGTRRGRAGKSAPDST
jgi:SAM-dependent methyltransferase